MIRQEFGTLAYTNSPKTSKRTTFQAELQAAVSARARAEKDRYSYADDFHDDEDDFLNELLKSREKKAAASKAGRNKAKINDFDISDDESKRSRTKRVSFLKTQRVSFPSEDTTASDLHENETDYCGGQSIDNNSLNAPNSLNASEDNGDGELIDARTAGEKQRKSFSLQFSGDVPLDESLASANSLVEPSYPEETISFAVEQDSLNPQLPALNQNHLSSADSGAAKEPPKPKPRQRTLAMSLKASEKTNDDAESLDLSQAQTSSVSIPLSSYTSSDATHMEGDASVTHSLSKDSSGKSEHTFLTKSTIDSASGDRTISDDSQEQDSKYSTSFEEQDSADHSHQLPHVPERPPGTRASSSYSRSSRKSSSSSTKKVESKYLGSLKVLDRKVLLKDSQSQGPDSLRAAIYQNWLQKKNEKSKESIQKRKKEELFREKTKKKAEEAKKVEAVASYEAWKEKKVELLRLKTKERMEKSRKEQRELEEREEKKLSAKQVYEKWKEEHDNLLKNKFRKQREKENKLKVTKEKQEEERKRDCKYAFSKWCEKKKNVTREMAIMERTAVQNKEEEERYIKEEKDKMSVEMYEQWLAQKDLQQKRRQEEKQIQEILGESPPPPWSPPNKTVPYRK